MLTPDDIQGIANDITDIYSMVEHDCITSIVRRLTADKGITEASMWQMKKLNDVGALRRDLLRSISKRTKESMKDLERLVTDSLTSSKIVDYRTASSIGEALAMPEGETFAELAVRIQSTPAFRRILKSTIAGCRDVMNQTGTSALQASISTYTNAVNRAYMEMMTGAYTREDCIRRAVQTVGRSGIKVVDMKDQAKANELIRKKGELFTTYGTGNGVSIYPLDSAIRRDVVTTLNRASGQLSLETCSELGTGLVETTWHVGARPEHERWQGRVFSLDRNDTRYPYFYAPQELGGTGYGDMLGLCGINCYHNFSPYFESSQRATQEGKPTAEENAKVYREQQRQRAYERRLRGLKREQVALREGGYVDDARAVQERINATNRNYSQFLKDTGRVRESMLERVDGYRRISTKA